jgi:hypothetical protein
MNALFEPPTHVQHCRVSGRPRLREVVRRFASEKNPTPSPLPQARIQNYGEVAGALTQNRLADRAFSLRPNFAVSIGLASCTPFVWQSGRTRQ